ncbi:uncharacterized protein BYT42DRAFT_185461 [Radiomyces spectabilis]|uniref:uncharacterized protein n=1 Tax=Radiomyces spectabilis TaxID=64574 RepID=UPI002220C657|nr:uncharacterized protein BYT42DRAFT_185461 [Radiomyces spectabilis]KAI8391200.1 hypothetical protein BYT42DRAFT_185461 [Radiomyces spectabilis]
MKPNSLRRYSLESRITPGIAAYLRNAPEQVNQSEGDLSAAAAIPSSDALIKFKDDMEKLIPHSYNRLASLKHDLIQIERLADPSRKVFSDEPINGAVVKEEDSGKDIAAVTQDKTRSQSTGIESKAERDKMEPLSTRQVNISSSFPNTALKKT